MLQDTNKQDVSLGVGEGDEDLDLDAMAMDAFGAAPRTAGGSAKRKLVEEEDTPVIAGQPPRPGAPKRPRNAAAVPAEKGIPATKQEPTAAAQPSIPASEVTAEEIAAELRKAGGGLPLQQIKSIFMARIKGKAATDAFKSKLLQVARSDKGGPDGKLVLVVLKDEWRQPQT
uniref:Transcription initiation factor IIF subunit alpha n=1 Tax=Dunaliella tertiolecta TaxID=3047 RepID=A0A7S3R7U0_DUNTE